MCEQFAFLLRNLPNLLIGFPGSRPGGLILSIWLAVVAILLGFVIALCIGRLAESRRHWARWSGRIYIEIFRGLPLVLLVLLTHQLVCGGRLGLHLSARVAALIALALYSSAYQSEIVRAGLRSVPTQLVETGRVMGGSSWQLYRLIKLRYTLRIMAPALTGQAISLFKDTSVVLVIGVAELMTVAQVVLGSNVKNAPYWVGLYIMVGALYFVVAFCLSLFAQRWERRRRPRDLVHSLVSY